MVYNVYYTHKVGFFNASCTFFDPSFYMILENTSNFREIAIGKIVPGVLYRSNHPICNNNAYGSRLIQRHAGV